MMQDQLKGHLQAGEEAVELHVLLPGVGACAYDAAGADGGDAHAQGHIAVRGPGGEGRGEAVVLPDSGGGPLGKGHIVHLQSAGTVTHHFDGNIDTVSPEVLHNAVEMLLHGRKSLPFVGAELKEHGRLLGDGIAGGAAGDGADVVGGPADGRDLHLVEPGNELSELGDGVGGAEAGIGMAAFRGDGDPETAGADRLGDNGGGVAVEGDEFLYPVAKIRHDPAGALQIAQALLAGVDDE